MLGSYSVVVSNAQGSPCGVEDRVTLGSLWSWGEDASLGWWVARLPGELRGVGCLVGRVVGGQSCLASIWALFVGNA